MKVVNKLIDENIAITVPCDVYKLKRNDFWMIKNLVNNFNEQYENIEISPRVNNYILHGVKNGKKVFLGFYPLSSISEDTLKCCAKTIEYLPVSEVYAHQEV